MPWECYQLYFKASSPVHIGFGAQRGVLNRTRAYIMPKHLWAFTTAQLARYVMAGAYDAEIYEKIGKLLKNNLIFSYFFPTLNPFTTQEMVYAPVFQEKRGLCYGLNAANNNLLDKLTFEARFLNSYVSTAVDKNWAAEEGSLHEMEFIRPKVNIDDEPKDVYYKGYLLVRPISSNGGQHVSSNQAEQNQIVIYKEDADLRIVIEYNGEKTLEQRLSQLLMTSQVGGERAYGWGALKLEKNKDTQKYFKKEDNKLFDLDLDLSQEKPVLKAKGGVVLLGHLVIPESSGKIHSIEGDFEPVVGKEWSETSGAGHRISAARVCFIPGTKISLNSNSAITIELDEDGFWVLI